MNRIKIKERGKKLAGRHLVDFWKGFLTIFVAMFLLGIIVRIVAVINLFLGGIAGILLALVQLPITIGFLAYTLKIVRGEEFNVNDIFKQYKLLVPILLISILTGLFIALWSLLFIIPGIIATFSYAMVYYILIDNPEKDAMVVISESKELMRGYKMDYFIFQLSFFGWMMLAPFTLFILYAWLLPYYQYSMAIYYDELKKLKTNEK